MINTFWAVYAVLGVVVSVARLTFIMERRAEMTLGGKVAYVICAGICAIMFGVFWPVIVGRYLRRYL